MRALGVVELDPIDDRPTGMLLTLEAMSVHALLFQRSDEAFDHAVLLGAVRRGKKGVGS
jgi:hypothetical protein